MEEATLQGRVRYHALITEDFPGQPRVHVRLKPANKRLVSTHVHMRGLRNHFVVNNVIVEVFGQTRLRQLHILPSSDLLQFFGVVDVFTGR